MIRKMVQRLFASQLAARLRYAMSFVEAPGLRRAGLAAALLLASATAFAVPTAPVITAAATVTAGKTGLTATTGAQTGVTFTWSFSPSNGGTITSGQGTTSMVYTAGPVGTYTLSCVAKDSLNNTATGTKTITVVAAPVAPTITSESSVTSSTTGHAASIAAQTGMTYTWTLTNGSVTAGAGTTAITYTAGATVGSMSLTCTVKNAANDTAASTNTVTVVAAPIATITASKGAATNLTTVTNGNTGLTATVPSQAGATYAWTATNAAIDAGAGTNAVTFHPTAASGTVTLNCTVTNSIGTATTGTKSLTIVPSPSTAVITTTADITQGATSHTISATLITSAAYAWQPLSGVTYTSGTAYSTSYTTTATNTTANASATVLALSCLVTNQDGASATITKSVNVWAPPTTPVVVTTKNDGTTAESQVTVSTTGHKAHIAAQNNATYAWTLVDGSITAGTGTTEVTFTAGTTTGTAAFKATCTVTNKAGTAVSAFATEDVLVAPMAVITASKGTATNLTTVTNGNTGLTASVASQAGSTYAWTATNAAIDAGAGTNAITFHPTVATGTVTLNCTVTNSLGTSATGSKALTLVPQPSTAVITTAGDITQGATSQTISATVITSATYAWQPVSSVTFTSGTASSTSYTTTATNTTANASATVLALSCLVTNQDGASATITKNVNVWAVPAVPVVVTTKADGTTSETQVTVSTTGHKAHVAVASNATYTWTTTNATITAGQGTTEITFTAGATAGTGNLVISCKLTNPAGGNSTGSATEDILAAPVVAITASKGAATNLTTVTNGNTGLTASVASQAGYTYAWTATNAAVDAGAGTSTITFHPTAATGTVTLSCTVTNSLGASTTGTKTLTLVPQPSTAVVTTTADITQGVASHTLSITSITSATYAWQAISGVTYTSGTAYSTSYTTTVTNGSGNASAVVLPIACLVTNQDGASATLTKNVNVWALPAAPTLVTTKNDGTTPETQVTASTSGHKAHAVVQPNTTYSWATTNASITAGQNTSEITFTSGATAGTANLVITGTAANPAGGTTPGSTTEDILMAPSSTIAVFTATAGSLNSVTTGNAALQARVTDLGVGATYAWTVTGGTLTAGQGTSSITFTDTAAAGGSLSLSVTVTNAAGTASTGTKALTVLANPGTATVTTVGNITEGTASHTVSVSTITGASYAWQTTSGFTYASGNVSSTSYTTTATNGTGNASALVIAPSCLVTNVDGASATVSKNVNLWSLPAAPTVVTTTGDGTTPETQVTASSTGHLAHIAAQPNATYSWVVTNGTITAGQGTTQITFTSGATPGTANLGVTCTVANPAGGTTAGSATEDILSTPVATITVSKGAATNLGSVTAGNSGLVASVPLLTGATYAWTVTGGTITAGAGTSAITITDMAAAGGTLSLSVTVTNAQGATATGSQTLAVVASPSSAALTTTLNITQGPASHDLSVTVIPGATYTWQPATNVAYASGTGATTSYTTPATNASGNASATYITPSCLITNVDGATATVSMSVGVWAMPAVPALVTTKSDGVTAETQVTASTTGHKAHVASTSNTFYAWTATNATITAGQGTSQITFTPGATTGTGVLSISCRVANPANDAVFVSATEDVLVAPVAAITASKGTSANLSTVTEANTGLTASVTPQAGATYAWTITGGSITAGAGTNAITFSNGTAAGGTLSLSVTVTNTLGIAVTGTKALTVVAAPSTATITTSASITQGTASHAISVSTILGASYAWQSGSGFTYASGIANSTSYTTTATNGTGNVSAAVISPSCLVTNEDGASATVSTNVNLWALPTVPTVVATANDGVTLETQVGAFSLGHKAHVAIQSNTTYSWTLTNGTITYGQGTSQITYTAGPTVGTANLVLTCTASNPAGGTISGSVSEDVLFVPVAISVSQSATTGLPYSQVKLAVSINNTADFRVRWTTTGGTLSQAETLSNGQYVSLQLPAQAGSVYITATSEADPTKSATAYISVTDATVPTIYAVLPDIQVFDPAVGTNLTPYFYAGGGTASLDNGIGSVANGTKYPVRPSVLTKYTLTLKKQSTTLTDVSDFIAPGVAGTITRENSLSGLLDSRQDPTVTVLPNGRVVVAGGGSIDSNSIYQSATPTMVVYDPVAGTVLSTTGFHRGGHTATVMPDGNVLFVGGDSMTGVTGPDGNVDGINTWAIQDPSSGQNLSSGYLRNARAFGHTTTLLPDGRVLIAGGWTRGHCPGGLFCTDYALDTIEILDHGMISTSAVMTTPRYNHTALLLNNGRVLYFGGAPGAPEIFDPSTNVSAATNGLRALASTALLGGKVLPDGRVLFVEFTSGTTSSNGNATDYSQTRCHVGIYDPVTDKYTRGAESSYSSAMALMSNGQVLLSASREATQGHAVLYDPLLNGCVGTFGSITYADQPYDMSGNANASAELNQASILPSGKVLAWGSHQAWNGTAWDTAGEAHILDLGLALALSPAEPIVMATTSLAFQALRPAGATGTLTWSVSEGAAGGSVSSAGLYTAPSTPGIYHVVVTSGALRATAKVLVTPLVAPRITRFDADHTQVNAGTPVALSWDVQGASSLVLATFNAQGQQTGTQDVSGTTSMVVNPTQNTSYTLTATNAAGNDQRSVFIEIWAIQSVYLDPSGPVYLAPGQSTTFTATVQEIGQLDPSVAWSATGGVIDASGVYTAPAATGTYTVTAVSNADSSKTATATIIVGTPATLSSFTANPLIVTPGTGTLFTWQSSGATYQTITTPMDQYGNGSQYWDVSHQSGLNIQPTQTNTYTLHVGNAFGGASQSVTVIVSPVASLAITPTTATMYSGATRTFGASITVATGTDPSVTWSAPDGGAIAGSGLSATFTAPSTPGTYRVVVTAVGDPTRTATSTVTVVYPDVTLSVNPLQAVLSAGQGSTFTSTMQVTGSSNTALSWSADAGRVVNKGASSYYIAPLQPGSYALTATSVANPSVSASASIAVGVSGASTPYLLTNPSAATVAPGQRLLLQVSYGTNDPTAGLTWTTTGGILQPDATGASAFFVAPSTPGTYTVTVQSPASPTLSAQVALTVVGSPAAFNAAPATATMGAGQSLLLEALDGQGNALTTVTWAVQETGGGLMNPSGQYIAPLNAGVYHVVGTSTVDGSTSTATITVVDAGGGNGGGGTPVPTTNGVHVSPDTTQISAGTYQGLSAVVDGLDDQSVTWTVENGPSTASVDATGVFSANLPGAYRVFATSASNPSLNGSAVITVVSSVQAIPGAPTGQVLRGYSVTALKDGRILIAGGYDGTNYLATAQVYDPTTKTFSASIAMLDKQAYHTATLLDDGRVLLAGGVGHFDSITGNQSDAWAQVFDPVSNSFLALPVPSTPNGGPTSPGAMRSAHATEIYAGSDMTDLGQGVASKLGNGQVLVAGGPMITLSYNGGPFNEWAPHYRMADVFNPATYTFDLSNWVGIGAAGSVDGWAPTPNAQVTRQGTRLVTLDDGTALMTGGSIRPTPNTTPCGTSVNGYSTCVVNEASIYDPATGGFRTLPTMNERRSYHTMTKLADGRVLIVGGYNSATVDSNYFNDSTIYRTSTASAEIYDPATGVFTPTGSLHEARSGHAAILLPTGQVLIVGGKNEIGDGSYSWPHTTERYDPDAGVFITMDRLDYGLEEPKVALLPSGDTFISGVVQGAAAGLTARMSLIAPLQGPLLGPMTWVEDKTSLDLRLEYISMNQAVERFLNATNTPDGTAQPSGLEWKQQVPGIANRPALIRGRLASTSGIAKSRLAQLVAKLSLINPDSSEVPVGTPKITALDGSWFSSKRNEFGFELPLTKDQVLEGRKLKVNIDPDRKLLPTTLDQNQTTVIADPLWKLGKNAFTVHLIPVDYTYTDANGNPVPTTISDAELAGFGEALLNDLRRLYPVGMNDIAIDASSVLRIQWQEGSGTYVDLDGTTKTMPSLQADWQPMLVQLWKQSRLLLGVQVLTPPTDFYCAVMKAVPGHTGNDLGLDFNGVEGASSSAVNTHFFAVRFDLPSTGGHELGHAHGRHHIPSTTSMKSPFGDPHWPQTPDYLVLDAQGFAVADYLGASGWDPLVALDAGIPGSGSPFITNWTQGRNLVGQTTYPKKDNTFVDIMGYPYLGAPYGTDLRKYWISDYTYTNLYLYNTVVNPAAPAP